MRVMILEDDLITATALAQLLAGRGLYVTQVHTDELAVEKFPGQPPDVLILDYVLPGMSGLEVLRGLRQKPGWARVPCVLASAAEASLLIQQVGPDDPPVVILQKPFSVNDLLDALKVVRKL